MAAQFKRREVLIPMVSATGGAVARIAADSELPAAHPAQLDRELSDLLECGLYQAGQQAKAAVRSMHRHGGGLLGRPPTALSVINPGDVVGLGHENSASAEFGLALAILAYQSQAAESAVIASGALDLTAASHEARVLPVHHIGGKLRLLAEHFSQPGSAKPPPLILLPVFDIDGESLREKYAPEIARLRDLGIEARYARTLKEAAETIGAGRIALRRTEQRARIGAILLVSFVLLAGALFVWLQSGIQLSFASTASLDGRVVATPLRIVKGAEGVRMLAPCKSATGAPAFEIHDQIGVRLDVLPMTPDPTRYVGGYHFIAVSLADGRNPRASLPHEWSPDGEAQYLWDVVGPPGDTLLVFLARRGAGFNADKLIADLVHFLAPLNPAEWESAAREFLADSAPGVLVFKFKTVEPGSCS